MVCVILHSLTRSTITARSVGTCNVGRISQYILLFGPRYARLQHFPERVFFIPKNRYLFFIKTVNSHVYGSE